jgi:hypothetical protein
VRSKLRGTSEVIGHMLAVPPAKRPALRRYSALILGALDPVVTPARLAESHAAAEECSHRCAT